MKLLRVTQRCSAACLSFGMVHKVLGAVGADQSPRSRVKCPGELVHFQPENPISHVARV